MKSQPLLRYGLEKFLYHLTAGSDHDEAIWGIFYIVVFELTGRTMDPDLGIPGD